MTTRDELANLIDEVAEHAHREGRICSPHEAADAILAAGYSRPRVVETIDELLALPDKVIVESSAGTIAARFDDHCGVLFGDERPFPWIRLALPATVLRIPGQP
ncbi:hypothetical protein P9990_19805 [Prescottella equi]|uniref:hypothetical protein n=1 Tax=Rhodococcus hoagii TaxID=43767 RepID=UPI0025762554|nr:hypothetical protein [Prescottella equi]WJJ10800.1 hypothetical protein P9990_19805 [Prescottella equi]